MKRITIVCAVILFSIGVLMAHPPSDIKISTDAEQIIIVVEHNTKDAKTHFIDDIVVWVNNKKMISQQFIRQLDNEKQAVQYMFPGLKENDKVKVEADCNRFGSLTKEIVVKSSIR